MKLGEKPLSQMSQEDCLEAVRILQEEREALRAEGIKQHRAKREARETKAAKRADKAETAAIKDEALKILMGEL